MRVVGGSARGRRIYAPEVASVRPTADRVREAMFDVLMHLDVVTDAIVVDLFAGSGGLGIEALSRGASFVTFVESDHQVIRTIESNLATLGFDGRDQSTIMHGDVLSYLSKSTKTVDLVFCDPPYSFSEWDVLLSDLKSSVIVLESNRPIELPSHFELHRVYRYGTTLVTVAMSSSRATEEVEA